METITKTKTVKTMKTINATKGELATLVNGLFAVQNLKGKDFSLVVSKNIAILREILQKIEVAGTPSKEFMILAKQVNEIANEQKEDAQEQIDKLEKDNKELVEDRRIQMAKVEEMMKEEATAELNIISEDLLPEDISAQQINNILKIIE